MQFNKAGDIDIKGLSSVELESLARRATRMAKLIKTQEPSIEDALTAGIESFAIKSPTFPYSERVGYRGEVSFTYKDGCQWLAKGHSGWFEDGSFWGRSYVEFLRVSPVKRNTAS